MYQIVPHVIDAVELENGARFKSETNTAAYWSNKIYKSLPLIPTSDPDATTACTFMCLYDDDSCSIALWDGSSCYLGDWNIDADLFTVTKTTAMTRRCKYCILLYLFLITHFRNFTLEYK